MTNVQMTNDEPKPCVRHWAMVIPSSVLDVVRPQHPPYVHAEVFGGVDDVFDFGLLQSAGLRQGLATGGDLVARVGQGLEIGDVLPLDPAAAVDDLDVVAA